jgi:hypothetical protein
MSKRLFVLLAAIVVLSLVSIPALAGPPEDAFGKWCYVPETMTVEKVVDGNQFFTSTDTGTWTGTFDGESDDACYSVLHSSGHWWGRCTVSFASVTVDGATGGLEMRVLVSLPDAADPDAEWDGKWVIAGGTGDLKDLRGQGSMSGPGWQGGPACGELEYWGIYHFEPD